MDLLQSVLRSKKFWDNIAQGSNHRKQLCTVHFKELEERFYTKHKYSRRWSMYNTIVTLYNNGVSVNMYNIKG